MSVTQYGTTNHLNDYVALAATARGYVAAGQTTGTIYTLNGVALVQLAQSGFQPTQIVVLSNGAYLLDRQQYPNQTQGGAHYEVLNADGSMRVADSDVASGTGHALGGPGATATANGGFFVGYTDYNDPGTTHVSFPPTSAPVYTGYDPGIAPDSGYRYFTLGGSPVAYTPGAFNIENSGSFSNNGASGSDQAGAQYFEFAATLSSGTVVAAYLNEEINGQSGGGAASDQTVDVRLVTSGGPGAAVRVNQDVPYTNGYTNAYYSDTTHAVRGDGGIQVAAVGTGFAVEWIARTYTATGGGGDTFTGYETNIRYYDGSGNPLTDTVQLVHRGTSVGQLYSPVAPIGGGRVAILYLDLPGNGSADQLDLAVVGPLGQSISTTVIAQGAAANDINSWALASKGDGTVAISYQGPSGNILSTYAIDRKSPINTNHDYNADGISDILFRNTATGDFGYSTINQGGSGATYHGLGGSNAAYAIAGIGDFNADGTSDILYRNTSTGDFGYSALNASTGGSTYVGLGGSNAAYAVAGIGDFNADGTSDILYRNTSSGDFGYSALDPATGGSTYKGLGGSNTSYAVVGIGDFNADGTSDILYRNNATGDFGYSALNASTGGSTYTGLGGSNAAYSVVGVGDFNGDGTSDILYRNAANGDFGYSALDPATGGSTYHGLGLSNTAYNVVGTGDYNGDGLADVLFRNPTSGDLGYEQITSAGQGSYISLGGSNASYKAY